MEKDTNEEPRGERVGRGHRSDAGWWRVAIEHASEIFKIVAPDGTLRYANAAFGRAFGYDPEEAVACEMNVLEYVHPEDLAKVAADTGTALAELEAIRQGGGDTVAEAPSHRTEYRFWHSDGSWRYVEGVATYLLDDPEVGGVVINARDITSRKEAEAKLGESERRFRQLFDQSAEALFVHDGEGNLIDCNAEASRSLGYTREELLHLRVSDLSDNLIAYDEQSEQHKEGGTLWQRILAGDSEAHQAVHFGEHMRKGGNRFPVEVRLSGVEYGGRRLILASVRDITERMELEEQLRQRALHDPLTGLPNRALFTDRLELVIERSRRERRERATMLFMDLDDFKGINDRYGHVAGDALLVAVSGRLSGCVRPGDTVSRFGGDEFAVLLESAGVEIAREVIARIESTLAEPFDLGQGRLVRVSASIGLALTEPDRSAVEILREADREMYRRKLRR